jgi:O-acetyl-ADP-ribose deacetylase (regulator of RNase III)
MIETINGRQIELVQGDITEQQVDAIVNAANSALAGGGGVDGAVHSGGGPAIMAETDAKYPHGCPTGDAVPSGAGQLPCKYVLHAVGPVWHGGDAGEPQLLASAYRKSLQLAGQLGCQSIALPALSTGAFGYPMAAAARVALSEAIGFLATESSVQRVIFVLFHPQDLEVFTELLRELRADEA